MKMSIIKVYNRLTKICTVKINERRSVDRNLKDHRRFPEGTFAVNSERWMGIHIKKHKQTFECLEFFSPLVLYMSCDLPQKILRDGIQSQPLRTACQEMS